MHQQQGPDRDQYPHGRGYGHDYMRGGEVNEGYGYSARDEYQKSRGELGLNPPAPEGPSNDVTPTA